VAKVFVSDATTRISLAITRSLGGKGIEVTVGGSANVCLTRFSKYCKRFVQYPSPRKYPEQFLWWLRNHLKRNHYDVLFPVDDLSRLIISKNKAELSEFCKIPIPDFGTIMKARDKRRALEIALRHDIPCPKTFFVEDIDEVKDLSKKIDFPVVIKPREESGAQGLMYAGNARELLSRYLAVHKHCELPLIQDLIRPGGPKYSFACLLDDASSPVAKFSQVAFRWIAGSTTFSLAIRDRFTVIIERLSMKLLKAIGWYGVAEVEWLIDPRDHKPKFLEVNPRFWSWVQLGVSSGVDFPYLLYRVALGEKVQPGVGGEIGMKFRGLFPGDILVLLGLGNKVKGDFSHFHNRKTIYAILSKDDPKPAFISVMSLAISTIKSLMRGEIQHWFLQRSHGRSLG